MQNLIDHILNNTPESFDYKWLGEFVRSVDVDELQYQSYITLPDRAGDYGRNICCLQPFELVLVKWPPGVESAVHHHKGFWGYVLCLEGELDNTEYIHRGRELREGLTSRVRRGGVIAEPDGVIHKLKNSSKTHHAVTLHFYYPALENMDGLALYDLETGIVGILNEQAKTATFLEPREHFKKWSEDAFEYIPITKATNKSHRMFPIMPKPTASIIRKMLEDYYTEQALVYDSFDLKHASRQQYINRINELISNEISNLQQIDELLDLACGTGRRTLSIKEASKKDYHVIGIDLSPKMIEVARDRGVDAYATNWVEKDVADWSNTFDVVTLLYAFGHICTAKDRKKTLMKIHEVLKPGGMLFLDVFNADDKNEWGPQAMRFYDSHELGQFGYEKGDVFYKKSGGQEVAFLHYTTENEILDLLSSSGFDVAYTKHIGYVYRSGEELKNKDEGSLFIKAVKK